jgi:hypothetical protein
MKGHGADLAEESDVGVTLLACIQDMLGLNFDQATKLITVSSGMTYFQPATFYTIPH